MKQIKTTQTVFDYLLMEIIKNRRKESETKEEAKEKIKRIGYEVGMKLTENPSQKERLNTVESILTFVVNSPMGLPFFTINKLSASSDKKKFTVTVFLADFITHLSSFGDSDQLNEMKELYISYASGLLYGTIEIRGFRINIIQCLSRPNVDIAYELTINVL